MDIHHYDKALKYAYAGLARDKAIPDNDRALIREFVAHLKAKGLSDGRVAKYVFNLMVLRRQMKCDFVQAERKDLEALMSWLNSSGYTAHTRLDFRGELKRFYKWLRNGSTDTDIPFPPEVSWIKENLKRNEMKQPDILTADEAAGMIGAAKRSRDKAFIAVAYEGGFRIGELLTARLSDLAFDELGARLRVRGKTGERTVRLISSAPLLSRWLEEAPKGAPDGPLWPNLATNYQDNMKPMTYQRTVLMLKGAARKAGITKRIYPHLFRHSAATRDAQHLTESELKIKYGWTGGSEMAGTYVHLSGADLDAKLAAIYGGREIKPPAPVFVPVKCPRCGFDNSPGQRFCGRCGLPLEAKELAKSSVELEELKQKLDRVLRFLEDKAA